MKFEEAEAKLKNIADGKPFEVGFGRFTYSDGTQKIKCRLYIEDSINIIEDTFANAFDALNGIFSTPQEPPDIDA